MTAIEITILAVGCAGFFAGMVAGIAAVKWEIL